MSAPQIDLADEQTSRPWWRRNRWGLLALPLALVAALVASSDRVAVYYWGAGLHDAQSAVEGSWLRYETTYFDAAGTHPRELEIRLDTVRELTDAGQGNEQVSIPVGARVVQVELSLRAEPDLPLTGCNLAVRDAAGTRYEPTDGVAATAELPTFSCVPDATPGPSPSLGDLDAKLSPDDSPPRPREWTVTGVVLVPADVTVTDAIVWWEEPDFARLTRG